MLRLLFFGAPRLELDGQTIPLRRSKALALLAYVATSKQPHDRDTLLALLWPEFDEASARNNLRRELSLLKSTLGAEILLADRQQVARNPQVDLWMDVEAFQSDLGVYRRHAHAPGTICPECVSALTAAAQLYTNDFMAGFSLPDCPTFDEWQFFQRESLRHDLAAVLQVLISWHAGSGEYALAISFARRWMSLDPLHEPAQRELMRLYAWAGQHSAALRQYDECARLLEAELGATPESETVELAEAIRARRVLPPARDGVPQPERAPVIGSQVATPFAPAHQPLTAGLPRVAGFVGRQRDLADIIRRLTDPDCRLLTLVGPGGIGKTRLAIQVAHTVADGWSGDALLADGVLYVPLVAVATLGGLVSALAAAARFDFYPDVPPQQQVLDYFRNKQMLVVLDNFEQLLDAAEFLTELLAAAPGICLLVTSRAALNLRDEWFHPIAGLTFPTEVDQIVGVAQLARFDAVRLFEQHARRVQSDFSLSRARDAIVQLCRLVEGMPLAIELAASWLKVLSVEQVLAALEHNLDILTARDRSTPERHRSMRAVLEESWALLPEGERQTLAGLAVFCDGFSAVAAQAVVGATFAALAALIDKSLLRSRPDGSFQLHELLRQFAAEKLEAEPAHAARVRRQHSAYYLELLASWGDSLAIGDQRASILKVSVETENIRAAWRWAAAHGTIDTVATIDKALEPLFDFYQNRGRYQEGQDDTAYALDALLASEQLAAHPRLMPIRTRLLARQGAWSFLLGDYAAASSQLGRALEFARGLALKSEEAFALAVLGQVAAWRGEYEAARGYLHQSLAIGRAIGDSGATAGVLATLAELHSFLGEYDQAKRLAMESLAVSRDLGRPDRIAHALDQLGFLTFCRGEYQEAADCYHQSLALFDSVNHQYGRALALGGIGLLKGAHGDPEAADYYQQSLAILRQIGHQRSITERLIDLSHSASDAGAYELAQRNGQAALAIARRLGSPLCISVSLCCLARAACELGDLQASKAYLAEALQLASATQTALAGVGALIYAATLLVKESNLAAMAEPIALQKQAHALEVLEVVVRHSSTWHVERVRAGRIADKLRSRLPAELAAAATERSRKLDWQASAEAILGQLTTAAPLVA